MDTLFVGKNFVEVPALDSTNSFAIQLLPSHPPEGTTIFSPHQYAGRGQQNSAWLSQPGENLTFSVVFYPSFLPVDRIFALNKIASLAIFRTLQPLLPPDALRIKWPNDILVHGQKIAGILIENQLEGPSIRAAVIGMGLNVNQSQFPAEFSHRTTSLINILGQKTDPKSLLPTICGHLEALYLQLRRRTTEALDRAYLQHLYAYQEYTQAIIEGEKRTVLLVGVDAQGRLAIEEAGRLRYFQMKEIAFVL